MSPSISLTFTFAPGFSRPQCESPQIRPRYVINVVFVYAEFRVFMLNICTETRTCHQEHLALCSSFRNKGAVVSRGDVTIKNDVKSQNNFFTAVQPCPQHTGFYFTLLRDEDQQDLHGSVLLSDQVDSKQVPLPDCFSSQRIKDCWPFFNRNSHTSPFKDCSDPFCDSSDI